MDNEEKIKKLEDFKNLLLSWLKKPTLEVRSLINQDLQWIRREVIEAGCLKTFTISPPPAIGGLIMQNIDPFNMPFEEPYGISLIPKIVDMIDQTKGVLRHENSKIKIERPVVQAEPIEKGYAFVAMPISPEYDDALDSIKESARRCGINAERIDEQESHQRITDRILESINKAEFVIVDLTESRPNVFFEAGYAHGIEKIPIYIARAGTSIEFDLKDYPVIFFESYRELKDRLEKRLRAIKSESAGA